MRRIPVGRGLRSVLMAVTTLAVLVPGAYSAQPGSAPMPSAGRTPGKAAFVPGPPVLEVKEFGGDFEKWSRTITLDAPRALTFRCSTTATGAVTGKWKVKRAGVPVQTGTVPAPPPGHWGYFTIDYFGQVPARADEFTVVVRLIGQDSRPVGPASAPVTVKFVPPSSNTPSIQVDMIDFLTYAPPGGILRGPTQEESQNLTTTNSIEVAYSYELITENSAEIRQFLLDENRGLVPHGFSLGEPPVGKGPGQVKRRSAVVCVTPDQPEILVSKVQYMFVAHGKAIAQKVQDLPTPIRFRCPESP